MGRSVSYPSTAVHKVYVDVSHVGMVAPWSDELDDYDYEAECVYDECCGRDDWDTMIDEFRRALLKRYKSVDEWIRCYRGQSEDHAIAENQHAYFGISEHCGLACVWVAVKDDDDGYHGYRQELSPKWCKSIGNSFNKIVEEVFGKGNTLNRVGTFSNGESFYERRV